MKVPAMPQKFYRAWQASRQRVLPPLRKLGQYWRGLTARERLQVLMMAAILAAALLWLLFTRPALHSLSHWQQELPRLRAQHAALQTVLAEVGGASAMRDRAAPIQQRLEESLRAAGLGGYELHAQQADWQVSFTQPVAAQALVSWLLSAPASLGMAVQQARIDRVSAGEQSTRVIASVTLAGQQQRKGE